MDRAEEALAGVHTLYVGHGAPAAPAVLAEQRRYLLMVREAIGRVAAGRPELNEDEANRAASLMERYLPSAPLEAPDRFEATGQVDRARLRRLLAGTGGDRVLPSKSAA